MDRIPLVFALLGLLVGGCGSASGPAGESAGHPAPAAPPPAVPPAAPPDAAVDTSPDALGDVTGGYFLVGKMPPEFAEIEHLSLATIDEHAKPAPLNGFIRQKSRSADDYVLVNPTLKGKELTFTTKAVKGFSYRFEGAFTKIDNFPADPPHGEEVILKGRLTKLRGEETVKAEGVGFVYSAGD